MIVIETKDFLVSVLFSSKSLVAHLLFSTHLHFTYLPTTNLNISLAYIFRT